MGGSTPICYNRVNSKLLLTHPWSSYFLLVLGFSDTPRPPIRSLRVSGIITTNVYRMYCGTRYETHTHTHTY